MINNPASKISLGLENVDNTSDANKPVSSATQTALNAKQATLVSSTNIKTVNGSTLLGTGDLVVSGADATKLAILNNLSDLNNASTARTNIGLATTANQTDSTNKRFVTDAQLTVLGNTSNTNTGDQTISDATITTTDITTNNFTTAKHGFVPKGTNAGNYLKDDGTWSAIAGGGDMVLASTQTVSGLKTFLASMFGLRNVANTFTAFFTNTITANRTYTLKDADGTLAFTSDITGTNSGTNTGDNATNSQYSGLSASKLDANGNGSSLTGLTKTQVGLANADNTTDAGKPVSTAQQTALNLKANITSQTFVTPNIGAATGTSLIVTGAITSSGGGNGYSAGAGGAVTQATSRTTTVVLNKLCGNITMFSAAQAANAIVTFTLTNSFIAAADFLLVQHISATNGGAWVFSCVCGAGSATISIANSTAASITSATPLRFTIIKGAVT